MNRRGGVLPPSKGALLGFSDGGPSRLRGGRPVPLPGCPPGRSLSRSGPFELAGPIPAESGSWWFGVIQTMRVSPGASAAVAGPRRLPTSSRRRPRRCGNKDPVPCPDRVQLPNQIARTRRPSRLRAALRRGTPFRFPGGTRAGSGASRRRASPRTPSTTISGRPRRPPPQLCVRPRQAECRCRRFGAGAARPWATRRATRGSLRRPTRRYERHELPSPIATFVAWGGVNGRGPGSPRCRPCESPEARRAGPLPADARGAPVGRREASARGQRRVTVRVAILGRL